MFWYTLVASGIYGQIVHDALCMVFVVCHLSSFGTPWSVVVQFGTHVVHHDNYIVVLFGLLWYCLISCGSFSLLVVLFGLMWLTLATSGTLWSHVAHLGH